MPHRNQVNRDELGLETYVVLGNALNLLLYGVTADDQARLALALAELRRLSTWLEPVKPHEILTALERLPEPHRKLLRHALLLCERIAGERADSLLGAPSETRAAIARFLQDQKETSKLPA